MADTLARARAILRLPETFTEEDVLRAARGLLFEIHPDTAGPNPRAGERVAQVLEARDLLLRGLRREDNTGARVEPEKPDPTVTPRTKEQGATRARYNIDPGRDGYEWYRRATAILGEALEEYWKVRLQWSHADDASPEVSRFHERLRVAKELFGRVLTRFPGGMWTADAVERIARINVWLRSEDGPASH